ncbi:MAG: hypothetical protein OXP66_16940 [Candidatus Tectomicrobia bacterium]|nr:hypothetical protein [Candidatus Tectomicrobia bacterium]
MLRKVWIIASVLVMVGMGSVEAQLSMGSGLNKDCIKMSIQHDICWTSSIPPLPYPCAHLSSTLYNFNGCQCV